MIDEAVCLALGDWVHTGSDIGAETKVVRRLIGGLRWDAEWMKLSDGNTPIDTPKNGNAEHSYLTCHNMPKSN